MPTRRRMEPYTRIFRDLGVEIERMTVTGKTHIRIDVRCGPHGGVFFASNSASDRRTLMNFKSDVRRWQRRVTQAGNPETIAKEAGRE